MATNGNEEIIWPSQVAAFLDDLFAVYETYRGHQARQVQKEETAILTDIRALQRKDVTFTDYEAILDKIYSGGYGQQTELNLKSSAQGVLDQVTMASGGGFLPKLRSMISSKMGLTNLARDEAVWAAVWGLWPAEVSELYLENLGITIAEQPYLFNLVMTTPDIKEAVWIARRWPDSSACGEWAKWAKITQSPLYDKYIETTSRPADPAAVMDQWFLAGKRWSDVVKRISDYGVLPQEADYYLWETRTKPSLIEAYRLRRSGLLSLTDYNKYIYHLRGHPLYNAFYEAEYTRRFGVSDWVRYGYWHNEFWYQHAATKTAVNYLGYGDGDKDILEYVSLDKPTAYDIITAWRRMQYAEDGEIPPMTDDDKTVMRAVGVHPKFMDHYWASSMAYPSAPDLITMAVREAFEPALVSKYGLSLDYPPEFDLRAKQIGIPGYWALKYWQAHWRLPSLTEGTEMLHRGIITSDEFRDLLKMADYTPYWRPKLEQVAYRVYTRVDVRRMYRVGVLTFNQVVKAYLDYGYDEERATNLAEFVKRQTFTTLSTINQTDVIGAYTDKSITRSEAIKYLTMIFIPITLIPGILDKADLVREVRYERLVCSAVERGYKRGKYEKWQAVSKMTTRGVPTEKATSLADLWELETE